MKGVKVALWWTEDCFRMKRTLVYWDLTPASSALMGKDQSLVHRKSGIFWESRMWKVRGVLWVTSDLRFASPLGRNATRMARSMLKCGMAFHTRVRRTSEIAHSATDRGIPSLR